MKKTKKIGIVIIGMLFLISNFGQSMPKTEGSTQTWQYIQPTGGINSNAASSFTFDPATGNMYVSFIDPQQSYKASVMKYDGTTWSYVGTAGFSTIPGSIPKIAFDTATNNPYITFLETSNKVSVMRYTGSAWEYVSSPEFSAGTAGLPVIAFNPVTHHPYVAYEDWANAYKLTVREFDGSSWNIVGSAGFGSGIVNSDQQINLVFNQSTGDPYVGYMIGHKATVMKYSSGAWSLIGDLSSSPDARYGTFSLNLDNNNLPKIIYLGDAIPNTVIMNYNGSSWQESDLTIPSNDSEIRYALNPSTYEPYAVFKDSSKSNKASVMKYSGSSWEYVGNSGFSDEIIETFYGSIFFNPKNNGVNVSFNNQAYDKTFVMGVVTSDSASTTSISHKHKKKKSNPKRVLKNSPSKVNRGQVIIQSGKKFSKNNAVTCEFSKPGGGYYAPTKINTDANGKFSTSYKIPPNKPVGKYTWKCLDLKTGKTSKVQKYTVL